MKDDPQSFKSLRWVLYDDDFAAYENVCIGDVDMLIARQEPSLCARRVRHSETIGLGGGPAAVRQFGNVLSLCDDLLAERAAR